MTYLSELRISTSLSVVKITPSSPVREIIYHRPRNLSRILEHYVEDFIADDDKCVACKQPANNLLVSCESDTIHIYPCCCPQHKAHINKIWINIVKKMNI